MLRGILMWIRHFFENNMVLIAVFFQYFSMFLAVLYLGELKKLRIIFYFRLVYLSFVLYCIII